MVTFGGVSFNAMFTVALADSEPGSVTVSLTSGTGSGGDAASDQLVSIENLIGSGFKDKLIGNLDNNALEGGAGNDSLVGYAGSDAFLFGVGFAIQLQRAVDSEARDVFRRRMMALLAFGLVHGLFIWADRSEPPNNQAKARRAKEFQCARNNGMAEWRRVPRE